MTVQSILHLITLFLRTNMSKMIYRILLNCLLLLNAYPASAKKTVQFDIINADIDSLKTAISKHPISCEQIIITYLNHIKKYNLDTSRGAAINAFVNIIRIARAS